MPWTLRLRTVLEDAPFTTHVSPRHETFQWHRELEGKKIWILKTDPTGPRKNREVDEVPGVVETTV